MAKRKTEVRLDQSTLVVLALIVGGILMFTIGPWAPKSLAPTTPSEGDNSASALTLVPAIEKTKIYLSTFDLADHEGESQDTRVAGSAQVIKGGISLETVSTGTVQANASTAEFNGGDEVTVLADASGYYAESESAKITDTLQPFSVYIKAEGAPNVDILDEKKNNLTSMSITLGTNEVSETHYIEIKRPGDDSYYNFCGIGIDYNNDLVDVRVKDQTGSFVDGVDISSNSRFDALKALGVDDVWEFNGMEISNFDQVMDPGIPFVIATAKDVDPSATNVTIYVFDCENDLQYGKIVYESETAGDVDLGQDNFVRTIAIN